MGETGRDLVELLASVDAAGREAAFMRCCGSTAWARAMGDAWPFASDEAVYSAADDLWRGLDEGDWLEAFGAHPRIGERDLAERWASDEQAGAEGASAETIDDLAEANRAYEARFGHTFLICATGLSAEYMLGSLRRRLANDPGIELRVAATEQVRITRLRLERLASEPAAHPAAADDLDQGGT